MFGLLQGHSAETSGKSHVKLPVCYLTVKHQPVIAINLGGNFLPSLLCTLCVLTGGLLIALPREQAAAFCKDIEKQEGYQSWIIGIVEKGHRTARIIDKPRVIEVPAKEKDGELW